MFTIFVEQRNSKKVLFSSYQQCSSLLATLQSNNSGSLANPRNTTNKNSDIEEFYKWFVGLSDAESSFGIFPLFNNKNKVESFIFKFTIGLHIDDEDVLNFIQKKLGFGLVYPYKNTVTFRVTKKEDI